MADGDYYSSRTDIDNLFGRENIARWADADNTRSEDIIAERVDWANRMAYAYVNGRLAEGRYAVPLDTPFPDVIVYIAAAISGAILFDTRRVVNAQEPDRVAAQKKNAM